MLNIFDPLDLIPNPRLRWVVGSIIFAVLDMIIFVGCIRAENTQCATITGLLGIIALCMLVWNGLIYVAQRRSGM